MELLVSMMPANEHMISHWSTDTIIWGVSNLERALYSFQFALLLVVTRIEGVNCCSKLFILNRKYFSMSSLIPWKHISQKKDWVFLFILSAVFITSTVESSDPEKNNTNRSQQKCPDKKNIRKYFPFDRQLNLFKVNCLSKQHKIFWI